MAWSWSVGLWRCRDHFAAHHDREHPLPPYGGWMEQSARNLTDAVDGFSLSSSRSTRRCCFCRTRRGVFFEFCWAAAGSYEQERVIRENLDLGRPDHVQLIFGRRVTRKTPGRFRTTVITQGVVPTLHVDYKSSPFYGIEAGARSSATIASRSTSKCPSSTARRSVHRPPSSPSMSTFATSTSTRTTSSTKS